MLILTVLRQVQIVRRLYLVVAKMVRTFHIFQITDLLWNRHDYNRFNFGVNLTYQSESYGTATETETEVFNGSPNARAGRIDSYTLLHFVGGYDFNDNFRLQAGVKMQLTRIHSY